jgi:hypothetical protein
MKAVLLAAALLALGGCSTLELAGARSLTQYAYAFVQQEAEEAEARDLAESRRLEERARRLYAQARDHGLRGLALGRPGFERALHAEPRPAVAALPASDVPLLYWTAASWAALIALSKDSPERLAELPVVEALIDRALELDESRSMSSSSATSPCARARPAIPRSARAGISGARWSSPAAAPPRRSSPWPRRSRFRGRSALNSRNC